MIAVALAIAIVITIQSDRVLRFWLFSYGFTMNSMIFCPSKGLELPSPPSKEEEDTSLPSKGLSKETFDKETIDFIMIGETASF